jgi:aspartate aminotransferase-like enzyme
MIMSERDLLMIPGPTNADPTVLRSLARPIISHVSETFAQIFKDTIMDLGRIFKTNGLILPLAGSGTLGAEVALANIIEPEDRVLAISGGYFAERLAEVAGTLGAKVDKLDMPWGSIIDPHDVEKKLSSANYKMLLVVHVDTSTGAVNPLKELGALTKAKNVLFVVDTVCSMAGMDVQVDGWGIDVCFTGSQKALAAPPGMAIVSFSSAALNARDRRKARMTTYYGDVKRWIPVLQDATRYFATAPVNMVYALHESCKMILDEGLEARYARHAKLASAFRAGLRAIGLKPLCEESIAAPTLTVAQYPAGVSDSQFRKTMAEQFGVVVAGGLGPLKERAFRTGHMGNVNINDIFATIGAIEGSLAEQHYDFKTGSGLAAVNQALAGKPR